MKKLKMLIVAITLSPMFSAFSATLVVQQNGPGGTYASISAAVTAAVDGDVILINNRTDALPWIENVIVNKSVTLIPAVDNVLFWVSGKYEIVRANNRAVSIVGMRNTATTNNLFVSGAIPSIRTRLKLSQCEFSGSVFGSSLEANSSAGGVRISIYATKFEELVAFSFGEAYGSLFKGALNLQNDPVNSNDTLFLVGNKFDAPNSNITLQLENNSQVLIIKNNLIYNRINSNTISSAIYCYYEPKMGSRITNCSLFSYNTFSTTYLYSIFNWNQIIENSIINNPLNSHDASLCFYNLSAKTFLSPGTGNINANTPTFNTATLDYSEITNTTNQGNPSKAYLDLDFSRNNIGMYGGSYNINNFFPINSTNSSVVNMVDIPKTVNQGQTLNLKAIATDK